MTPHVLGAIVVDTTVLSVVMALFAAYYLGLYAYLRVRRWRGTGRPGAADSSSFVTVLVVPAHNEELVIGSTIEGLLELSGGVAPLVLVMNDGSTDRTREIARSYEHTGSVFVVDRPADLAGRGKGTVLNHAYRVVLQLLHAGHPRFAGRTADEVIIGVIDADGVLEPHTLSVVLPYFADTSVGGVQIGVSIANAARGLLPRLQDIEFVGFSGYIQEARDGFGSVGLGGNGQFTRLSGLMCLDGDPWSDCLTEDLDLGLRLLLDGWKIRFCRDAFVLQQGVESVRPLLRQRTRWFQGHYQCWRQLPEITRSPFMRTVTKLDLTLYLVLVVFVVVITAGALLTVAEAAGLVVTTNASLRVVPSGAIGRLAMLTLSLAPVGAFMLTYQQRSRHRLRAWELPAYTAAFILFTYSMTISQLRAWTRLAVRRDGWAKTARVAEVS